MINRDLDILNSLDNAADLPDADHTVLLYTAIKIGQDLVTERDLLQQDNTNLRKELDRLTKLLSPSLIKIIKWIRK